MPDFDAFMKRVLARPLPNNPLARVRTLAKELAEGAAEGFWDTFITITYIARSYTELLQLLKDTTDAFHPEVFNRYVAERWQKVIPSLDLLSVNGYIDLKETGFYIGKPSFDLLSEVEPSTIFISYRRRESSAFALLVLARLKEHGLDAFVDMTIQPGDNWHAHIREQIQGRDYFVSLLAPASLESEVVQKEILWAIEAGAAILPIWHNGFTYPPKGIALPPEIDRVLSSTHTIRVLEESALAYNNAIIELLNRFGVTP